MRCLLFLIAVALAPTGCTTYTIAQKEVPVSKTGSPLRGVEPRTIVVRDFADSRDMKKLVGSQSGRFQLKIDRPVTGIVSEAIARELERNGHRVSGPESANQANVVISGDVLRYWVFYLDTFWKFKSTANVDSQIRVAAAGVPRLSKTYRGQHLFDTALPIGFRFTKMSRNLLDEALLDMVRQFTTDPEFLAILRESGQAR
jgi:hypothetical protein